MKFDPPKTLVAKLMIGIAVGTAAVNVRAYLVGGQLYNFNAVLQWGCLVVQLVFALKQDGYTARAHKMLDAADEQLKIASNLREHWVKKNIELEGKP